MSDRRDDEAPCQPCQARRQDASGATRRDFLQSAGGCFAVAIAALGLSSAPALALPVGTTTGSQTGSDRRYPIPAGDSVNVDRDAQTIVVRNQGHVYVFALTCPHQNAAVKWLPRDHRFQCTKHDSEYQPDGIHTAGRATRNLDRFAVRRDGEFVVADLNRLFQSDKEAALWAAAAITV
jgi:nitrite reductase/ring-hydroxylating ferredoxin subunit